MPEPRAASERVGEDRRGGVRVALLGGGAGAGGTPLVIDEWKE